MNKQAKAGDRVVTFLDNENVTGTIVKATAGGLLIVELNDGARIVRHVDRVTVLSDDPS